MRPDAVANGYGNDGKNNLKKCIPMLNITLIRVWWKPYFLSNNIHDLSINHMLYFENMIYIQPEEPWNGWGLLPFVFNGTFLLNVCIHTFWAVSTFQYSQCLAFEKSTILLQKWGSHKIQYKTSFWSFLLNEDIVSCHFLLYHCKDMWWGCVCQAQEHSSQEPCKKEICCPE